LYNPMDLTGKRILVTGASSGLGRETSIILSKLGAKVVLVARNKERLEETFSKLEGTGHCIYRYDLEQLDGIPDFLKDIAAEQGRLSGLFHAAGVASTFSINMIKEKNINSIFTSSAFASLMLAKGFGHKDVREEGPSSIVFMSSAAGLTGTKGMAIYSSSKAAVDGAVRAIAVELAEKSIRVNSIAAGMIKTEMHSTFENNTSTEVMAKKESMHPLGFGAPTDVALAAAFLLSDASRWITGITMVVDGGFTISKQ